MSDLGGDPGSATWAGRPVAETQRYEASRAGLRVMDDPGAARDVVMTEPGVVATAEAIRAFVLASQDFTGDVAGTVHDGGWSEHPAFGAPARLFRLRGGGPWDRARADAAAKVEVHPEVQTYPLPLSDVAGGRVAEIRAGRALVIRVEAWPGLLWANLLTLAPVLERALAPPGLVGALRVAWGAVRAGSWRPEHVSLRLVRRDAGVVIEPGAVVQGSYLGAGVRIGAGAVVRHALIGPGAVVEPQALVIGSVLGPGARVQRRGFASFCVMNADSVCGGTMQLSVLGPRAQLKVGALLQDQILGGDVKVATPAGWQVAPLGLLGAALGADALVGAGVQVAAGRRVPPGVQVVAGPDQVLLRPEAAAGRYRVRDGRLEPC